jgi:hypothetical protein
MSTIPDKFDAIRTIVNTLQAFGPEDRTRILRWAAEELGLTQAQISTSQSATVDALLDRQSDTPRSGIVDIKSFVGLKKPKNDSQFAAVVAYYYRFEAPDKKDSITKGDLLDACRQANYQRPPAPGQTLRNAVNAGLLDKADRGAFTINSVGENLVAVTLPGDNNSPVITSPARRLRKKRSPILKYGSKKRSAAKK